MNKKNKSKKLTKQHIRRAVSKQIANDLERVKQEALRRAVHDLTAAFLLVMNDTFGFGKKRLEKLLERVNTQFECILSDYVTVEEIKQWCIAKGLDYESIFVEGETDGSSKDE